MRMSEGCSYMVDHSHESIPVPIANLVMLRIYIHDGHAVLSTIINFSKKSSLSVEGIEKLSVPAYNGKPERAAVDHPVERSDCES